MADKKHLASQIREVKARMGRYSPGANDISSQFDELRKIARMTDGGSILTDFIPIRIATFIEVLVRNGVKEIVDAGPPYSERASKFEKRVRFDYLLANAIHGNQISLGDIISNSISINSLPQIISIFETLLGANFCVRLASIDNHSKSVLEQKCVPIITHAESVLEHLGDLFAVRHILVHEIPSTRPYQTADLEKYIDSANSFLLALEELITRELHGDYAVTQREMNAESYIRLKDARCQLAAMIRRARSGSGINKAAFWSSQKLWRQFCDAEGELHAALVEGGSMWPMIFNSVRAELFQQRTKQVSWWVEREESEL